MPKINWKIEPYKSARCITGNMENAIWLINTLNQIKEYGLSEIKQITPIFKINENYK